MAEKGRSWGRKWDNPLKKFKKKNEKQGASRQTEEQTRQEGRRGSITEDEEGRTSLGIVHEKDLRAPLSMAGAKRQQEVPDEETQTIRQSMLDNLVHGREEVGKYAVWQRPYRDGSETASVISVADTLVSKHNATCYMGYTSYCAYFLCHATCFLGV